MAELELLLGKVQYDKPTRMYRGKVLHVREIEEFTSDSIEELRLMMADTLSEEGADFSQLDNPLSDKLILELEPSLHLEIVDQAELAGLSAKEWITLTLEQAVDKSYYLEPA